MPRGPTSRNEEGRGYLLLDEQIDKWLIKPGFLLDRAQIERVRDAAKLFGSFNAFGFWY